MTSPDSPLAQGIAAAKAGDQHTARQLLTRAVRRNPDSEAAWLWLSTVLKTPQGRAFCLRRVLALNPANQTAQRGLRALEKVPRGAIVVAQAPPAPQPRRVPPRRLPSLTALARHPRFWQILVAGLGVVAFGLLGALVYTLLAGPSAAEESSLAAAVPSPSPGPRGTLRPTFTPTPTDTPTPTHTPTPTLTPTPTPTFTPTPTETPTPTPTRRRVVVRPPTATPTALPVTAPPRPTLPPCWLDPRLASLGVHVEPAPVVPGQPYWCLIEARWADMYEAAGKHSIFIEVLDAHGNRALGQSVIVQWSDGNVVLPVEDCPPPDWPADFGMYNLLGSYAVSVGGAPSDRIVGLGLGTAEAPYMKIHTSFYLTFRWVYW